MKIDCIFEKKRYCEGQRPTHEQKNFKFNFISTVNQPIYGENMFRFL